MWKNHMTYDMLVENWTYTNLVIQESLRIEPPLRLSTALSVTEPVEINGIMIEKNYPILVDFYHLHRNPKEW